MKKRIAIFTAMVMTLSIGITGNAFAETLGTHHLHPVSYVMINDENFPDKQLRDYVRAFDEDKNEQLSKQEIQAITKVYFDGGDNANHKELKSLKGIEYLENLNKLYLFETQVDNIDLSKNTNLLEVQILQNTKSLIFPQNSKITQLRLVDYEATQLDLSVLPELQGLQLRNCVNTEALDLSKNSKLVNVSIEDWVKYNGKQEKSGIREINVGDNEKLSSISLSFSNLQKVKFGKTPSLSQVYISNCKKLKAINTSNMPMLKKLFVRNCGLKALNVSKNPKLKVLVCNGNKLVKLNVSKNKKLTSLDCRKNKIKKIDISKTKVSKKKIKCDKGVLVKK